MFELRLFLLEIHHIFQHPDLCTFPLFPPSPLLPRSYCTSCPSSPLKMISTSCSNISGAQRVWRTKTARTTRLLSGSAHAVSGSFELRILLSCMDSIVHLILH